MKMKKMASIEIWNRKFYLAPVLDFMDSIVSNHSDMEYGKYSRLRYVVGEVLENRIKKAYPGSSGRIAVEFYINDSWFEVSINDKGEPVWEDFSYNYQNVDIRNNQELRNYILDLWVDEIGMEKLGTDGQRIYIRVKILNPIQFKEPEPYPEIEVLDTNISIRPVETEEDVIEAIRCIYSEYGYSYAYDRLYYVDSFMKMIKNKELMSFLAVNEHGQTAGHFALAFSDTFKNMPEISTVVTRKEFRGLGLFAKFMDYCMELGKQHGIRAFMGQPVGFHPMSQKAFLKSGFTATAILLAYIYSDIESEYNKDDRRLDLFASVKILDENAKSSIYPPKELYAFINKIYNKIGWKYELLTKSEKAESTKSSVETNSFVKITKIVLRNAADDFEKILENSVKEALRKKTEMIEMMISLNDPSCEYAYRIAKKHNFVFAGILPGGENADYLMMQMLVGFDNCYDQLVTVGEFEELTKDIMNLNDCGKE